MQLATEDARYCNAGDGHTFESAVNDSSSSERRSRSLDASLGV